MNPQVHTRFFYSLRMQSQLIQIHGELNSRLILSDGSVHRDKAFVPAWRHYGMLFDNPNTRRMMFDARQALTFSDVGRVPDNIRRKVRLPFDQFYLEFSEPIVVGEQEPGVDGRDYLRALMVYASPVISFNESQAKILFDENEAIELPCAAVTFFLSNGNYAIVDRSWVISLESGISFVSTESASGLRDASDLQGVPISKTAWFPVGLASDFGRYMGWWERLIDQYSEMFTWMMAYIMAKGIHIVEEQLPRAQRRLVAREYKQPNPWHIVEVEPRFQQSGSAEESDSSRKHSFRYDVIGHIRAGRHRLGDGSYREGLEWVGSHQRGLANSLYIPATHRVKGGKEIDPRFTREFGKIEERGSDER